jgi:hypothetical protein
MRYFVAEVFDSADIGMPSEFLVDSCVWRKGKWDVFSVDDKGFVQGLPG